MKPFASANAFDLSHDHKLTCNMGYLVPCLCMEVCPGDVFRWNADMFLRLMPLLAPIMHDVDVYVHCFFDPSRLEFDGFESFITGGPEGNDSQLWPHITAPADTGFAVGSLADYLGLPTGVPGIQVSALPFRAYARIYNEWYRDQNLIDPLPISMAAGEDTITNTTLQKRAWHKDYFTGSLPWAQRGETVYLPLGLNAPVYSSTPGAGPIFTFSGDSVQGGRVLSVVYEPDTSKNQVNLTDVAVPGEQVLQWSQPNLLTDLRAATAVGVNDVRVAFQIMRFMEKNARGGARYIEWLLSHFGVRSSDSRLQRPEYLGGGKCPVTISEVLQTSSTDATSPQGNMAGRAVAGQSAPQFTKYFEEFGYLIGILSIMPRASYQQGLPRMWTRKTRYDYPLPVFSHLGNQEVKNQEIYAQSPTVLGSDGQPANDGTFGYQERYEELRRQPSTVHGQFRSSLNFWHMGRIFDNLPQLNKQFVECDATKRIFAVTDQSEDSCIVQIHHNIQAIRRFPKYGDPGFIDHD